MASVRLGFWKGCGSACIYMKDEFGGWILQDSIFLLFVRLSERCYSKAEVEEFASHCRGMTLGDLL